MSPAMSWPITPTRYLCDTSGSTDGWDGRVYGAVLVAALQQDNAPKISYEVADGNVCLNYQTPQNTFALTFPGSFTPGDDTQPELTTVYLAGNEGIANSLYFNNKLLSANAADGGGQDLNGDQWVDQYLDVDHWDISGNLASQDNQISFDRGDATYLHPVLVVLRTVAKSGAQAAGQGQTAGQGQIAGQGQVAGQSQDAFNDIQNHWARAVINQLAQEGIVSGFSDQGFHPDALISRAQFAALLVKALSLTPAAGVTPTFGDVPAKILGIPGRGDRCSLWIDLRQQRQLLSRPACHPAGNDGDAGQSSRPGKRRSTVDSSRCR